MCCLLSKALLTLKQLVTHGCVPLTEPTDALVLKHQAISIHSADEIFNGLHHFHTKISYKIDSVVQMGRRLRYRQLPSSL